MILSIYPFILRIKKSIWIGMAMKVKMRLAAKEMTTNDLGNKMEPETNGSKHRRRAEAGQSDGKAVGFIWQL